MKSQGQIAVNKIIIGIIVALVVVLVVSFLMRIDILGKLDIVIPFFGEDDDEIEPDFDFDKDCPYLVATLVDNKITFCNDRYCTDKVDSRLQVDGEDIFTTESIDRGTKVNPTKVIKKIVGKIDRNTVILDINEAAKEAGVSTTENYVTNLEGAEFIKDLFCRSEKIDFGNIGGDDGTDLGCPPASNSRENNVRDLLKSNGIKIEQCHCYIPGDLVCRDLRGLSDDSIEKLLKLRLESNSELTIFDYDLNENKQVILLSGPLFNEYVNRDGERMVGNQDFYSFEFSGPDIIEITLELENSNNDLFYWRAYL